MSTKPTSAKEQMLHLLRELAFARMVDRGLADSDAGRTIDHAEMKRTLASWRK